MLKIFDEDYLGGYNPWVPWQQQSRKIIENLDRESISGVSQEDEDV